MKNVKKSLLALALISTISLLPYHGDGGSFGGGFATGALLGTGLTLAATRGGRERSPEYYENKDTQARRREINKQIKDHQRDIRQHEKDMKQADRNNKLSADTKQKRREEHQSAINEIESLINDLKKELRRL